MNIKNCYKMLFPLRKNVLNKSMKTLYFIKRLETNLSTSFQNKNNETLENKVNHKKNESKDFEKSDAYQDLKTKIREVIEHEKIVLFMKGTPEEPLCGFSAKVVHILNLMNVKDYVYIDVMKNNSLREAIKIYSDWPYIPHLYINKNFIGGYDIIYDLYNKGELESIVNN